MRTKSFLLYTTSLIATTIFLILFNTQQPDSLQTIVKKTHQHIKIIQNNFKDESETTFQDDDRRKRYLELIGLDSAENFTWHNVTSPVIVSYSIVDDHPQAIGFVRSIQSHLPNYTILFYNLAMKEYTLNIFSNYCNSSKCMIINFDLNEFPSYISDSKICAFKPLIIQHALSRAGSVIFIESDHRVNGTAEQINNLYNIASKGSGVLVWPRRPAISSLTHPRMFSYFHTNADNFLFVSMIDVTKMIVIKSANITNQVMKPWVLCALTHDCISPIGAQSGGCRFDKKPQYRYSGCHSYDASALSIVLGLNFDDTLYKYQGQLSLFTKLSNEEAREEYSALERNLTSASEIPFTNAHFRGERTFY